MQSAGPARPSYVGSSRRLSDGTAEIPEDIGAFFRELGPKAQEVYVTTAEKLTAQVRAKALEQGRTEGRAEGQTALLIRLLTLRFGPVSENVQARIRVATPAELDRWAERVLSASTLGDVFER